MPLTCGQMGKHHRYLCVKCTTFSINKREVIFCKLCPAATHVKCLKQRFADKEIDKLRCNTSHFIFVCALCMTEKVLNQNKGQNSYVSQNAIHDSISKKIQDKIQSLTQKCEQLQINIESETVIPRTNEVSVQTEKITLLNGCTANRDSIREYSSGLGYCDEESASSLQGPKEGVLSMFLERDTRSKEQYLKYHTPEQFRAQKMQSGNSRLYFLKFTKYNVFSFICFGVVLVPILYVCTLHILEKLKQ